MDSNAVSDSFNGILALQCIQEEWNERRKKIESPKC